MDSPVVPRMKELEERRRHRRIHVVFEATLHAGGSAASGLLFDLSAGGAQLRLCNSFDSTRPAMLRLARGASFQVELVWRQGNFVGLRFKESPARIARMLAGLLSVEDIAA